jgi:hypothetical protein
MQPHHDSDAARSVGEGRWRHLRVGAAIRRSVVAFAGAAARVTATLSHSDPPARTRKPGRDRRARPSVIRKSASSVNRSTTSG